MHIVSDKDQEDVRSSVSLSLGDNYGDYVVCRKKVSW